MLIRLLMHHVNNPGLIDKLIVIHGLPKEWIFRKVEAGDQLIPPWEPDNDVNIPKQIRHLCDPITFVKFFQPVRHYDQTYKEFWDKRTVLGLRLDYSYGPGKEMWDKIEDYIDRSLPRGEKMPSPVLTAKNHKEPFETYDAKKSERGGGMEMRLADIPVVDLRIAEAEPVLIVPPAIPIVKEEVKAEIFQCKECSKSFEKQRALQTHEMHHRRAKVAV